MTGRFENELQDGSVGFTHEVRPGAPSLVAFGGLAQSIGMPPFEFFGLVADFPADKLFLRDLDQAYYQRGIRGLGSSVIQVAEALKLRLRDSPRTVFVGNSAGGYAALLFGTLVGADHVIAIAPQTNLTRWHRFWHRDDLYRPEVVKGRGSPASQRQHLSLRRVLRASDGATRYEVHYPTGHRLDRAHALQLRGLPRVALHPRASNRHGVVRDMRDEGALREVLLTALNPDG